MEKIRYHPRATGQCHIAVDDGGEVAEFEFGVMDVERDVQFPERRRFAGYYVRIEGSDGVEWIGRSTMSVVAAMRVLDDELAETGGRLLVAGLHADFYETALSEGSGFGYISGYRDAVHIMERPLLDSRARYSATVEKTRHEINRHRRD
ncbi:hypothetical protein [Novosphingobium sp. P6W]|uniref:hypothetical protein n=1 Tax=Novosphingobium sp. P6W TaxID=1609758 RepID=UPI0005C2BBF5|nr:hypothetical protein [Novosphingobium sp. P6W]AXB77875.1 hypothetical protein TQ38_016305 [Novosphingobium sp. P6W]KIS29840.1 hypothetical protein TQ38_26105 [Novosphingobium sp. P6W]